MNDEKRTSVIQNDIMIQPVVDPKELLILRFYRKPVAWGFSSNIIRLMDSQLVAYVKKTVCL